jgi:hypothetical protein
LITIIIFTGAIACWAEWWIVIAVIGTELVRCTNVNRSAFQASFSGRECKGQGDNSENDGAVIGRHVLDMTMSRGVSSVQIGGMARAITAFCIDLATAATVHVTVIMTAHAMI